MPHTRQSESALARIEKSIVAARDGSFTALGQLLDHYRDYLLRVANDELASDLAPKIAPSDLVQETFLQAARRFPNFRGGTEAELRAWLRQILLNKLKDTHRHYRERDKRLVTREIPLDAQGQPENLTRSLECQQVQPGARLLAAETSARVQKAIEKLPDSYRRVIALRHFERRSLREISIELGCTPNAVRKLWCRAVEKLIRELAEHRPAGQ